MHTVSETPSHESANDRWLNRNVIGVGLTSFLADLGYETANAVLPSFVRGFARPALVLGAIEGTADAVSSAIKLVFGWWSDRIGKRKPFVVVGYFLTGIMGAFFAMANSWIVLLVAKSLGWFGKGIRGPLRNAILTDSVPAQHRGKAFGLHRACDTMGAVLGPLLGYALLTHFGASVFNAGVPASTTSGELQSSGVQQSLRTIFWLTLIPGIGSALAFAIFVKEQSQRSPIKQRLWTSIRSLPKAFHRFLVGVGFFGMGDFAHTLLVLAAVTAMTPLEASPDQRLAAIQNGALLYAIRNIVHAFASFPIGALSDKIGARGLLLAGYILGSAVMIAFAAVFYFGTGSMSVFVALFAVAGLYISIEESLENVLTADLVPQKELHGTAFGLLGLVNGIGDLFSSLIVGLIWEFSPYFGWAQTAGFLFAAAAMAIGAAVLHRVR